MREMKHKNNSQDVPDRIPVARLTIRWHAYDFPKIWATCSQYCGHDAFPYQPPIAGEYSGSFNPEGVLKTPKR